MWIEHGLVTERKGLPITVGMWEAGARWRQGATQDGEVDTTTREEAARHWEVYTDGAGQQGGAGWGYVCVKDGEERHAARGPVVVSRSSAEYKGAEGHSNNTGELSAVIHALQWILYKGVGAKGNTRCGTTHSMPRP